MWGGCMLSKEIQRIIVESVKNKLPFVETFKKLKGLGLTHYTVDLNTSDMIYKWNGGMYVRQNMNGFKVEGDFSSRAIKSAIDFHNENKTSFLEFLADIASKGCDHYVVEFDNNRVIYYAKEVAFKHIEPIPGYMQPRDNNE